MAVFRQFFNYGADGAEKSANFHFKIPPIQKFAKSSAPMAPYGIFGQFSAIFRGAKRGAEWGGWGKKESVDLYAVVTYKT